MQDALTEFVGKAEVKYREGQEEHSGNLWEKNGLLGEANKEVIDLVFYLAAHRQRLSHIAYKVQALIDHVDSVTDLNESYNHLRGSLLSIKSNLTSL